jgi:predicted ATPase/DNA-binding XRE family transcriptional regulator
MTVELGRLLRELRERAGLSQEELAERSGLSPRGVSGLERGERRRPYPHTIRALADALGLDGAQRDRLMAAARPRSDHGLPARTGFSELPVALTPLVGRDDELRTIQRLLGAHRLVTLTGMGGVGKSRLGLAVATQATRKFPDGVWLVRLEDLVQTALVPQLVALGLGLPVPPTLTFDEATVRFIADRRVLLVLDGCERLVEACSVLAVQLIGRCSRLRVLATSQRPLEVPGQEVFVVPPLVVPDLDGPPRKVRDVASVRLFLDRAALVRPGFAPDDEELDDVAKLCRQLAGIPLSIELAAAWVRLMEPKEILSRLADPFRLLQASGSGLPPRQRTLRATMEWSCGLLEREAQVLFARLAVFSGGFTLEAAEAVCSKGLAGEPLLLLSTLLDRSLIVRQESGDCARYRLLDPVRWYALERLGEGKDGEVRRRHAEYYLRWAESVEPELWGPDQEHWLDLLAADLDNLRAGLVWWSSEPDGGTGLLRLAAALAPFWIRRGGKQEGREWLRRAVTGAAPSITTLRALYGLERLKYQLGEPLAVRRSGLERYLAMAEALGSRFYQARAHHHLSNIHREAGRPEDSAAHWRQAFDLAQESGDARTLALVLNDGCPRGPDTVPLPHARDTLRNALRYARNSGDAFVISMVLDSLAGAELAAGDLPAARARWEERIHSGVENPWSTTWMLEGMARLALIESRPEHCLLLLGAAATARTRTGVVAMTGWSAAVERDAATARSRLVHHVASSVWERGRQLALEDAIALAIPGRESAGVGIASTSSSRGATHGSAAAADSETD